MQAHYSYNGVEVPAEVSLEGGRLVIRPRGAGGPVHWYYEQVLPAGPMTFAYAGRQTLRLVRSDEAAELEHRLRTGTRRAKRGGLRLLITVILAVLSFALLLYLWIVPAIAERAAGRFPRSQEVALGNTMFSSLRPSLKEDREGTLLLNRFFRALSLPVQYPIQLHLVEDSVANAYALPGGHIVVHSALMRGVRTPEALAALLAHETMHVERRHSLKSLFRAASSRLFLTLLIGDLGAATAILVEGADNLKGLSYGRSLETEADTEGARLLSQRGVPCTGFTELFSFLQGEARSEEPPQMLSSHPALKERIRHLETQAFCRQGARMTNAEAQSVFRKLKGGW